jgi:Domain of unknown function (DUF4304)
MMNPSNNYKQVKTRLSELLRPSGFVGAGDIIWRGVNDTVVVIEFQRDLKHVPKSEVRFTINVGISLNVLRDDATNADQIGAATPPSTNKCHWRNRLGRLLIANKDQWWTVDDEKTACTTADYIARELVDEALPVIEAEASSAKILVSWQAGIGPGLTEYERLVYLIRLLIALGRREEAGSALQVLREVSQGKSWERSAAYDLRELSKQIA